MGGFTSIPKLKIMETAENTTATKMLVLNENNEVEEKDIPGGISEVTGVSGEITVTNGTTTPLIGIDPAYTALKQDVLTEENVGEFMDLDIPTKLTPDLTDTLLSRDLITNNAVEVTIGSVVDLATGLSVPLAGTTDPITGTIVGNDGTIDTYRLITGDGDENSRIEFVNNLDTNIQIILDSSNLSYSSTDGNRGIYFGEPDKILITDTFASSKGLVGNTVFDKQNNPNAFAQMGDIATGYESAYTTTTQSITANTDTVISFAGATMESNGGLALIDEANNKITPLLEGDIIDIDITIPLLTPAGTNNYCSLLLKPFGTTNVYRAITHSFLKGSGNQDYVSANWTVPVGAGIISAGGLTIHIVSSTGITLDSKYISVSRIHKAK